MPDFFVPADTAGNSEFFNRIYRKGLIYTFAYAYADSHRDQLNEFTSADEIDSYLEKQDMLDEFIKYAAEKEVATDVDGVQESEHVIKTQLKAYIARNIMGEEGFYPIIKEIDNTLQRAIEITRQNYLVENVNLVDSLSAHQIQ